MQGILRVARWVSLGALVGGVCGFAFDRLSPEVHQSSVELHRTADGKKLLESLDIGSRGADLRGIILGAEARDAALVDPDLLQWKGRVDPTANALRREFSASMSVALSDNEATVFVLGRDTSTEQAAQLATVAARHGLKVLDKRIQERLAQKRAAWQERREVLDRRVAEIERAWRARRTGDSFESLRLETELRVVLEESERHRAEQVARDGVSSPWLVATPASPSQYVPRSLGYSPAMLGAFFGAAVMAFLLLARG